MPRLEINLFGLPQIKLDGNLINLKTHKAIGLIAYLAILKKRLSRETIASIFWPQDDQKIASGSLRTTLWRINKSGLREWLKVDRETIRIEYSNTLYIDAIHFLNLIEKSTNHGHSPRINCNQCISILKEIVEIYHTGFMQSYYINDSSVYEEWQLFQQERMRFLFSSSIGRLVNAFGNKGDLTNAITYAQHWLMVDPYHDEANRTMMQLYIDAGQRESALRHYDEYVSILKRDLKISPDESITRIYHQIKNGVRKPKFSVNGSSEGVIFHVNFSSITMPFDRGQDFNPEILRKYTDHLVNIIQKYGGKILGIRLDSITALFIDGDPLNCALTLKKDHKIGLEGYKTSKEPTIVINSIANETYGDLLTNPKYTQLLGFSQTAWEGQILFTPQVLAKYDIPNGGQVVDLGTHTIIDSEEPMHVLGFTHPQFNEAKIREQHPLQGHLYNFPQQTTPFIGRDSEISLISSFIQGSISPLISIVGQGGIGKTRLAVHVVTLHAEMFRDGVYFISIDSKTNVDQFFGRLSDTLNVRLSAQGNPEDQIIDYLLGKHVFLMIDNFEYLVGGSSILVNLIQRLPTIKVILASRTQANLKMELVLDLQGLSCPGTDQDLGTDINKYSACQLFIQSARRILPEFDPDADQQRHIAQICRSVDGSPLAIELAAPWLKSQTCAEISENIRNNLDFLHGNQQDLPDRHRSLRAVFDQSWVQLLEDEQQTIRRLSIFRGSFDGGAAQRVTNTSIQNLASCVEKSLLHHNPDGSYRMPESIRYFAEEKLNEIQTESLKVINEFCKYYGSFSQECTSGLLGHEQLSTLEAVRLEMVNIVHAWSFAVQAGHFGELDQFVDTCFLYHEIKCLYHDGSEYFRSAFDAFTQVADERFERVKIRVQARLGVFLVRLGNYEEGLQHLEETLSMALENQLLNESAFIQVQLGDAYRMIGEIDQASKYITECVTSCEAEGVTRDPLLNFSYAQALLVQGALHSSSNELDKAKRMFLKSIDVLERAGNLWWAARAYGSLSYISTRLEDYKEAKKLREKNLTISKNTGDKRGVAVALNNLASILEKLGETDQIIELLSESLEISQSIGDRRLASIVMQNLAQVYLDLNNDFYAAEKYYLESINTFKAIGDKRGTVYALHNYACALLDHGDITNATVYCRESLRSAQALMDTSILLFVLSNITKLFLELGNLKIAAQLCGYLLFHPEIDQPAIDNVKQSEKKLQTKMTTSEYQQALNTGKSMELSYFTDNV